MKVKQGHPIPKLCSALKSFDHACTSETASPRTGSPPPESRPPPDRSLPAPARLQACWLPAARARARKEKGAPAGCAQGWIERVLRVRLPAPVARGGRGRTPPPEISLFSFSLHRSFRSLKFLVMVTSFVLSSHDFSQDFCAPVTP